MGFPWQEHWSGLPFPPPGDLPDPGVEPGSPVSPAVAGGCSAAELPGKPQVPRAVPQLAGCRTMIPCSSLTSSVLVLVN